MYFVFYWLRQIGDRWNRIKKERRTRLANDLNDLINLSNKQISKELIFIVNMAYHN